MSYSKRYETGLVAIMFFTWGSVFLDRMSQLYLAPYFAPEFHLTPTDVGLLASALSVTWALSSFGFGAVSDRVGRRPVLIPMVFLFSILSWVTGLVRNFAQMFVTRAAMGVAEGPCWSVTNAIVEQSSHPSRRGRNVGIVVSAAALIGLGVAPVLTTQVAANFGWRVAFFVAGVPGLIMAVLIWKFVKEPKDVAGTGMDHSKIEKPTLRDYASLLRYRNVWLCCIGAAGFIGWLILQNVFAPLYITEVMHKPGTTAGFLLGAAGLGSFIIGFIAPAFSDRLGRKPVLLVMSAISIILPLALLSHSMYNHLWLLAGILFVTQGGQAVTALIIVLVPTESVPRALAASAIGLVTLFGEIIGSTIAPTVAGELAGHYGLQVPLLMAAGGMVLVFLVGLFIKEPEHQGHAQDEMVTGAAI